MIIVIINYNDHYRTTEILIVLYDSNIYIYLYESHNNNKPIELLKMALKLLVDSASIHLLRFAPQ